MELRSSAGMSAGGAEGLARDVVVEEPVLDVVIAARLVSFIDFDCLRDRDGRERVRGVGEGSVSGVVSAGVEGVRVVSGGRATESCGKGMVGGETLPGVLLALIRWFAHNY